MYNSKKLSQNINSTKRNDHSTDKKEKVTNHNLGTKNDEMCNKIKYGKIYRENIFLQLKDFYTDNDSNTVL
ncbi:hypothetical protein HEP_00437700, partial [Hepatocystis sp. ex Piliocolobus tephrosceles]